MPPLNLFSRRKARSLGNVDPLVYDQVDQNTRVRIIHVVSEYFESLDKWAYNSSATEYWESIVKILREELGVFQLPGYSSYTRNDQEEAVRYFLSETVVDRVVDWIELVCKMILVSQRGDHRLPDKAKSTIDGVNRWLREASIGYEFVPQEEVGASEMITVSDRVSHAELVLPALHLLSDKRLSSANTEFLAALAHLRKQEFGDAISEAAKSLETTLKILAATKGWPHDPARDTLKKLLDTAIKHGGHDTMWQAHFDSVRALLESGLGTARNRLDAHGQGAAQRVVPEHLARFAVHQAAAAMLLFAGAAGLR